MYEWKRIQFNLFGGSVSISSSKTGHQNFIYLESFCEFFKIFFIPFFFDIRFPEGWIQFFYFCSVQSPLLLFFCILFDSTKYCFWRSKQLLKRVPCFSTQMMSFVQCTCLLQDLIYFSRPRVFLYYTGIWVGVTLCFFFWAVSSFLYTTESMSMCFARFLFVEVTRSPYLLKRNNFFCVKQTFNVDFSVLINIFWQFKTESLSV